MAIYRRTAKPKIPAPIAPIAPTWTLAAAPVKDELLEDAVEEAREDAELAAEPAAEVALARAEPPSEVAESKAVEYALRRELASVPYSDTMLSSDAERAVFVAISAVNEV